MRDLLMYTVVVLYPPELNQSGGDMTYTAHVRAADPDRAMIMAVGEAVLKQANSDRQFNGWRALVCFPGHHDVAAFGWEARKRHAKETGQ